MSNECREHLHEDTEHEHHHEHHHDEHCDCHDHHDHDEHCGCHDHDHHDHEHHHHDHDHHHEEGPIEITTHDAALVGTVRITLPMDYDAAKKTMTGILEKISGEIEEMGGLIGHIKAYLREEDRSGMISITGVGSTQVKEDQVVLTHVENANIVFGIEEEELEHILEEHFQEWIG